jgi:uncharacterized protein (DUF1697 family)
MALVVFLRGINVGGQRAFRPSVLANQLGSLDAVNVGAAGTLVVRNPGSQTELLSELRRRLPFEVVVAVCDGRDLLRLEAEKPFEAETPRVDLVQFVSVLSENSSRRISFPHFLPSDGDWFVRIQGAKGRLIYGLYRRQMKTIGYLGQIDLIFGAPATTRSWSTILSVLDILKRNGVRAKAGS